MASELEFNTIESVLEAFKNGEIVIIADDPDRENEADLVAAASLITPEKVAFMANHGRGLICTPISEERSEALGLAMMTLDNNEPHKTAFTVSIDAAEGITTGISAADRARTIRLLTDETTQASDFVQPGHTFPLVAKNGGVLRRAGHTEASVDLAIMSDLPAAGVICEIMHADGTMARIGELGDFQKEFGLKACTIAQLIEFRRRSEKLVERVGEKKVEFSNTELQTYLYKDVTTGVQHVAFVGGEVDSESVTPVRVHSGSFFKDLLPGDTELSEALAVIQEKGGVLLYLRSDNAEAALREEFGLTGSDTKPAERLVDYGVGAQILYDLGVRKIDLLTNAPKNLPALEGYGLEVVSQTPLDTV